MATKTVAHLLLETMAPGADENPPSRGIGNQADGRDQSRHELQRPVPPVANQGDANGDDQRMAYAARLDLDQRSVDPFSLPDFNRLVRTRMLGGVGRAGEIPALTRFGGARNARNLDRYFRNTRSAAIKAIKHTNHKVTGPAGPVN